MAHWETTVEDKWIHLSDSLLDDNTGHGPLRTGWKYMHWARCWERVTNRLLANNRIITLGRRGELAITGRSQPSLDGYNSLLTIVHDGMDQAKFRCPRNFKSQGWRGNGSVDEQDRAGLCECNKCTRARINANVATHPDVACHRKYPCAAMIPTDFRSREGKGDDHDACHRNGEGKGAGKWEGKGKDRRTLGDARDRSAQATGGGKAGN